MEINDMIEVLTAYKEGKTIQIDCGGDWADDREPDFNFYNYVYRVKPAPREFWILPVPESASIQTWRAEMCFAKPHVDCIKVREVLDDANS